MKKMVKVEKQKDGRWVAEDGTIVGREIELQTGTIILENEAGEQKMAIYGTIINDVFNAFCTGSSCGAQCVLAGKGACRYNRKIADNAGYYLLMEESE